jgi:hypothetical protein
MKDNKIDDLFQRKLSHQKLTPPPSAWAAVEQNLPEKKKKGIYFWMSAAASILLIGTLGWLLLSGNDNATTPDQTLASETTAPEVTENTDLPKQDHVTKSENEAEEPVPLKKSLNVPSPKQLMARNAKESQGTSVKPLIPQFVTTESTEERVTRKDLLIVSPIDLRENLTVTTMAREVDYDIIMPLVLSDYYIPATEEMELAPRKKKFRVLNGIISIAKEVNNGKLSFSELRNAKNSFVNDDLKYGAKVEEGAPEDTEEDEPNKD